MEQGLIEFIPHLCECTGADAEPIHPYGVDWSPSGLKNLENAVGHAAHEAGRAMRKNSEPMKDRGYLAPVRRDYPDVQMVGIARLRYRPHTKRTSEWWAVLHKELPKFIETYNALRDKAEASKLDIKGNQGSSKGINGSQGVSRVGQSLKL